MDIKGVIDLEKFQDIYHNLELNTAGYLIVVLGGKEPQVMELIGLIKCLSNQTIKVLIFDEKISDKVKSIMKVNAYKSGLELKDLLFISDYFFHDLTDAFIKSVFAISNTLICPYQLPNATYYMERANKDHNIIITNDETIQGNFKIYYINLLDPLKIIIPKVQSIVNILKENPHTKIKTDKRNNYLIGFLQ